MKFPFILLVMAVIALAGGLGWKMEGGRLETMMAHTPAALSGQEGQEESHLAVDSEKNPPAAGTPTSLLDQWAARLAAASTNEDLRALADELLALENEPEERSRLLQLLCARWVETDPEEVLAYLADPQDEKYGRWNNVFRDWVLKEWALRDVEAVWALVSRETDEQKRRREMESIGRGLLSEGLPVFWSWFQKARVPLPSPWQSPQPAWLALARAHPQEMEALARELAAPAEGGENGARPPSVDGLFIALAVADAGDDPAHALEKVRTFPENSRNICLRHLLPLMAATDLGAATTALNMYQGGGREDVEKAIAMQIAKSDPEKAIKWVQREDSRVNAIESIFLVAQQAMAEKKWTPQEAFAIIREQRDDNFIRVNVFERMWAGLPAAQLAETAEWLKGVDSVNAKKWALSGVLSEWAKTDKGAALAFASRLEDASLARKVSSGFLQQAQIQENYFPGMMRETLAEIPPAALAGAIVDHVQGFFSNAALDKYSGSLMSFDGPAYAAALAKTPAAAERDEATQRVFQTWGATDPDAAMGWVAGLDDPALRQTALMGAMEGWVKYDAWSASQWLAEQPRGADRDQATHQLVRSLREAEPDSAWAWAADIGDAATRLEARAAVLRQWREADPAAAREAVSALPHLPPAERQKLSRTLAGQD